MKWIYVFAILGVLSAFENPEENEDGYDPDLFEGDMILTTEQRMAAKLGLDVDNPFGRASTKGKQLTGGVTSLHEILTRWTSEDVLQSRFSLSEQKYNFDKYGRGTIDSLGTKYDYGSVMHYHSTAFTKNGKPAIVAEKPGVKFGQRERVSQIDAQQMNVLYKKQCEEGVGGGGGGDGGDGGNGYKDSAHGCAKWVCAFKQNMAQKSCRKTCGLC